MEIGSLGLALFAGVLSTLSPCVIPLLPIVFGAAAAEHRLAPLALGLGVVISFTVIGLFIATIGYAIGLDVEVFRVAAATMMVALGAILIVPSLQYRLAAVGGPVSNWAEATFSGFSTHGMTGRFFVGLLLEQSGAHASARRSAPLRYWRPRAQI